jgi:hypothetical protein
MKTIAEIIVTFSRKASKPRALCFPKSVSAPPSIAPSPCVLTGDINTLMITAKLEIIINATNKVSNTVTSNFLFFYCIIRGVNCKLRYVQNKRAVLFSTVPFALAYYSKLTIFAKSAVKLAPPTNAPSIFSMLIND